MITKNLYCSARSLTETDTDSGTVQVLHYVLSDVKPAGAAAGFQTQARHQDTVQSPSPSDLSTYVHGALFTMTIAPTPAAASSGATGATGPSPS